MSNLAFRNEIIGLNFPVAIIDHVYQLFASPTTSMDPKAAAANYAQRIRAKPWNGLTGGGSAASEN